MDLISCNFCGVVFDRNKLDFPAAYNHETGEPFPGAGWNKQQQEWISSIDCPVCKNPLFENQSKIS